METKQTINLKLILYSGVLCILFVTISYLVFKPMLSISNHTAPAQTFWKYQCIDTMKTSRDRARNWQEANDLHNSIAKQIAMIKKLGANCVAIDTPYDPEFLPYLTQWVQSARKNNLQVWFRGNFSGWEGWFDYRKNLTSYTLLKKTHDFIVNNPYLFADGDIFTPAPEAENGGEFDQVEPNEYPAFRQFLIDEYTTSKDAFTEINKRVTINYLSMNGGLAKRMLDQDTITQLGNVVTIDHYIKSPSEMEAYISYFSRNFSASVVLGEFGAPIPDINGNMTEDEQAQFIDRLLGVLYKQRDHVQAVNYWVLYDSSTALINPDGTPRKVTQVIQKYFSPMTIQGTITDTLHRPIDTAQITDTTYGTRTYSDANGTFSLTLPKDTNTLLITAKSFETVHTSVSPTSATSQTITLNPTSKTVWYKLQETVEKNSKLDK